MRNTHIAAILFFLSLVLALPPLSVNPQTPALKEISFQAFDKKSGELIEDLSSRDIELLVDGKKREIVSFAREKRGLSVVVVVVTTPWTPCFDDLGNNLYLMGRSFTKILDAKDDVAVVLTDNEGTVQRPFGSERSTLEADLSLAEKAARQNSSDGLSDEMGMPTREAGLIYPLSGLDSAVRLFSDKPQGDDRLILFVRHMENTRAGKYDQSRKLLEELLKNNITVGWIGSTAKERSFDADSVEYGSRSYFLGLSSITGGYFQPCRETANLFDVLFGSPNQNRIDPDSELRSFLDRIQLRYRIKFGLDTAAGNPNKVSIAFRDPKSRKNVSLDFPKVIY
jgi:hypothetical protein